MPYMTRIPSDLARFGLKVELVPGWETRGSSSFAPACVVDHWTAGPRGSKGRPSLNICTNGRAGLPGPLANVYLARDGTCVVLAAGRANHAGVGGFRGLVGNSAAYGIEAESGGDGDWTPEMLDAYPRLNAALLSGLGRDASWLCGHHLWAPTRKIDIRDIFGQVQRQTANILANRAQGDFLMALSDAEQTEVLTRLRALDAFREWGFVPDEGAAFPNSKGEVTKRLRDMHALVAALAGRDPEVTIDAASIADAIPADLARQVADELGKRLNT